MHVRRRNRTPYDKVLSACRAEFSNPMEDPEPKRQLSHRKPELLPRFTSHYTGLMTFPPPAIDQRDIARPQGTACGIGAIEIEATATPQTPSLPGTGLCFGSVATVIGPELGETLTGTPGTGDDVLRSRLGDGKDLCDAAQDLKPPAD